MKYLITGGAGFIGSHLTESLLADGNAVTVIDDFSTGSAENLAAVRDHRNLTVIEEDILTGGSLEHAVGQCDCVIHLAAAVGVELVVHDPVRTLVTNVHGSERVLTFAADAGKRCILASTSEVYGKSTKPFFKETDDLCIGPSTNSRWSYACREPWCVSSIPSDRVRRDVTAWFCRALSPPHWKTVRCRFTAPVNRPAVSVM